MTVVLVVDRWTARQAVLLQGALRMSRVEFARALGVGLSTVVDWHDLPDRTPQPGVQRALDVLLADLDPGQAARFDAGRGGPPAAVGAQVMRVAIAVVVRAADVLLVCRRTDGVHPWQFPAGTVKPEGDPATTAVRETLAETGVRVAVDRQLGERVHPVTGVLASYWWCTWLAGEPSNLDPVENTDVTWAPRARLNLFIPPDRVFGPVLNALEGP